MIYFSLNHILEQAPYKLDLLGSEFIFQTDLGIHYVVSFNKEDITLGGCATYQLIIRKIEEVRSRHDPKVEATILAIINEFSVPTMISCFTYAILATDERNTEIGCFFPGSTKTRKKTVSPSAKLMQKWKVKACFSVS